MTKIYVFKFNNIVEKKTKYKWNVFTMFACWCKLLVTLMNYFHSNKEDQHNRSKMGLINNVLPFILQDNGRR